MNNSFLKPFHSLIWLHFVILCISCKQKVTLLARIVVQICPSDLFSYACPSDLFSYAWRKSLAVTRSSDLSIRAVEQPLFHGEAPQDLASLSAEWCRNINSALISFELYYFCLSARVASHKTKVYLKLAMFEVNSAMDEGRRLGGGTKGLYVYVW